MQVILHENVRGVGQKGEVKNVNPGYARNFLIPRGLASPANQKTVSEAQKESQTREKEAQDFTKVLKAFEKDAGKNPIEVSIEVGEKGEIFASLQDEVLKEAVSKHRLLQNLQFTVSTEKPVKQLGTHKAVINLGGGLKGQFTFELKAKF